MIHEFLDKIRPGQNAQSVNGIQDADPQPLHLINVVTEQRDQYVISSAGKTPTDADEDDGPGDLIAGGFMTPFFE